MLLSDQSFTSLRLMEARSQSQQLLTKHERKGCRRKTVPVESDCRVRLRGPQQQHPRTALRKAQAVQEGM